DDVRGIDRALVVLPPGRKLAPPQLELAKAGARERVIRGFGERLLVGDRGPSAVASAQLRLGKAHARLDQLWIERQGMTIENLGFRGPAVVEQDRREIHVRGGVVRADGDRPPQRVLRLVEL